MNGSGMLSEQCAYDFWANRTLLVGAGEENDLPRRVISLFAHTLSAYEVWQKMLQGETLSEIEIWPDLGIAECKTLLEEQKHFWTGYLVSQDEEGLAEARKFSTPDGRPFALNLFSIISQLMFNSAHHRGQIALVLREVGMQPPQTEFSNYLYRSK